MVRNGAKLICALLSTGYYFIRGLYEKIFNLFNHWHNAIYVRVFALRLQFGK